MRQQRLDHTLRSYCLYHYLADLATITPMLLPCDPETLSFSRECDPNRPLFPGINGQHLEPYETIEIFRSVIQATGATMQRPGPGGMPMERFCEHVCRVSGAQMLTRRGFPLDTVQLIGRWRSDAIKVCVCRKPHYIEEIHIFVPRRSRNHNRFAKWSNIISKLFEGSLGSTRSPR